MCNGFGSKRALHEFGRLRCMRRDAQVLKVLSLAAMTALLAFVSSILTNLPVSSSDREQRCSFDVPALLQLSGTALSIGKHIEARSSSAYAGADAPWYGHRLTTLAVQPVELAGTASEKFPQSQPLWLIHRALLL